MMRPSGDKVRSRRLPGPDPAPRAPPAFQSNKKTEILACAETLVPHVIIPK
jgi:hypothetical protein